MNTVEESCPTRESLWRSVVLCGRNVATYKFAVARSLLEVASAEKKLFILEELAEPFSRHVAEHLRGGVRGVIPEKMSY